MQSCSWNTTTTMFDPKGYKYMSIPQQAPDDEQPQEREPITTTISRRGKHHLQVRLIMPRAGGRNQPQTQQQRFGEHLLPPPSLKRASGTSRIRDLLHHHHSEQHLLAPPTMFSRRRSGNLQQPQQQPNTTKLERYGEHLLPPPEVKRASGTSMVRDLLRQHQQQTSQRGRMLSLHRRLAL